ncbi:MAG: hypothetical protein J6Y86_06090 [Pseudobutyrivibrio sp.]|nr:hypothetical protein [Pseudobutyrivibrio sp.]
MSRKILCMLLAGALVLAGCGKTNVTGDSPQSSESQSDDSKTDGSQSDDSTGEVVEYSNDLFKIKLPAELDELAEVDTESDKMYVYYKEAKDAGFNGLAFIVWAADSPSDYAGGPYEKVGELSSENGDIYNVVKGYATEVQWDYNEPEMPEGFAKLYDAADSVVESLEGINGYTYTYEAGTKGEDLYNTVLSQYVKAVNEKWDATKLEEKNMSPEFAYAIYEMDNPLEHIGYAYKDINIDGVDELFVGIIYDDDELPGAIYDIYTIVDNKPALVVSGTARNRYYNFDNHFISNVWSGGAGVYGIGIYNLESNSTEMVYQWGYKCDTYENEDAPWFKTYDGEEYEAATEEETQEAETMEEKNVIFDYTPLAANEDAIQAAEL